MKYRPEIDGLRTVAVLAVVFYHAEFLFSGINPFKGGYIGVDVFFVVSGYLIASIILSDLKNDIFSFTRFYERRARRILPALFVVMLASIPFAWSKMLPNAMKEYAGSVLSSLFFSSNFWFWKEDSYWAEPSALKPFLHTWTLSAEEQFYILFPLLLFLLWRFAPKYILGMFLVLSLLSLQFAETFTARAPEFTFYLLPARGWELLAGALLAKLEMDRGRVNPPILGKLAPTLGICLIGYSIIFFTDNTKHPSYITLIPVVGTMLIIWFCRKGELITDVLSSKAMVGVGLISYSLYLWHYPVFAFARMNGNTPSHFDKTLWILLTLLLAVISYFLVERPFRNRQTFQRKTFVAIILFIGAAIASFQLFAYKTNGIPSRLPFSQEVFETFRESDYKTICHVPGGEEELFEKRWCKIGAEKEPPSFIVIGDSHANAMMELLHSLGVTNEKSGLFLWRSGCPPFLDTYPTRSTVESANRCVAMNNEALELVKQHDIKNVFFVARWDYYLNSLNDHYQQLINTFYGEFSEERSREVFKTQLTKTISAYAGTGARLIIMSQVPRQNMKAVEIYKIVQEQVGMDRENSSSSLYSKSLDIASHNKRNAMANRIFREQAKGVPYVDIIDPTSLLCGDRCPVGDLTTSYYFDRDHISPNGSRLLRILFEPYF